MHGPKNKIPRFCLYSRPITAAIKVCVMRVVKTQLCSHRVATLLFNTFAVRLGACFTCKVIHRANIIRV